MKRILSLTVLVALFSLSAAAYAGPSYENTRHRKSNMARTVQQPFALKGDQTQFNAGNYHYETELRWVGPHKSQRLVHIRVPSAQ